MFEFPISGVETYWWLPILVSFLISSITSMGGVSGAFLLLPFQVSVLGFTGPAVSATNLIFNIVAIPSGIYRFYKEKRMVWSLVWTIIIGTLPGVFLGAMIRIRFLPDPRNFKLFAGFVLLFVGGKLLLDIKKKATNKTKAELKTGQQSFQVKSLVFTLKSIEYEFDQQKYRVSTIGLFTLSFIVGIIGGTYGVGGGSIIAPFLVTIFYLPVHTIAGAALCGTFFTSIAGVIFYSLIAPFYSHTGLTIQPDWLLGITFGIGGAAGIYTGARLQKRVPVKVIKLLLAVCVLFVALKYLVKFLG